MKKTIFTLCFLAAGFTMNAQVIKNAAVRSTATAVGNEAVKVAAPMAKQAVMPTATRVAVKAAKPISAVRTGSAQVSKAATTVHDASGKVENVSRQGAAINAAGALVK